MMTAIETGYFLLPKNSYSQEELKEQALKLISFLNIDKYIEYDLRFCINNNIKDIYAVVTFNSGKIKEIRFHIKERKIFSAVGKRITDKLKNVSQDIAIKSLDEYLGKIRYGSINNNISSYRTGLDLHIIITRFSDGVNSNWSYENNLGASGNYISTDGDINNAMAIRSLDSDKVPYHECLILREIIQQAIKTLAPHFRALILLWYFPEKYPACKVTRREKEILTRIRNKNEKGYKKIWYLKWKALEALRLRVIDIQE